MRPPRRVRALGAACAALVVAGAAAGAPGDARSPTSEPARARVAAQCAAFWVAAGEPARAARFRALARRLAARADAADRIEARLRPAMARLAADADDAGDAAARALFDRHASLCAPP